MWRRRKEDQRINFISLGLNIVWEFRFLVYKYFILIPHSNLASAPAQLSCAFFDLTDIFVFDKWEICTFRVQSLRCVWNGGSLIFINDTDKIRQWDTHIRGQRIVKGI